MFHRDASKKTIATAKMKPFVALVGGFQPLNNVAKNSISGVPGVIDPPVATLI